MINLNEELNLFIDECLKSSLRKLKISPGKIFHTILKEFPTTYNECNAATDYIRLKAKEYVLNEMLIQLAHLYDDSKALFFSNSTSFTYSTDIKDNKFVEAYNTLKKCATTLNINETVKKELEEIAYNPSGKRINSSVLKENKKALETQRGKFKESKNAFSTSEIHEKTTLTAGNSLYDYITDYDTPFSMETYFEKNQLLFYMSDKIDKSSAYNPNNVPIHFAPFFTFFSNEIQRSTHIYTICESIMYKMKRNEQISREKDSLSNIYTKYANITSYSLYGLSYMHQDADDLIIAITEIMLNKILHYEFFHSSCELFKFMLDKVSFDATKDNYRLPESIVYYKVLSIFSLFNVNLDKLSPYRFFDELYNLDQHLTSGNNIKTLCNSYLYNHSITSTLSFFAASLHEVYQSTGTFISKCYKNADLVTTNNNECLCTAISDLLEECKTTLFSINDRWRFPQKKNKKKNNTCKTQGNEIDLDFSTFNKSEIHVLACLLDSTRYNNILNSDYY